jgi:hypothetical protein
MLTRETHRKRGDLIKMFKTFNKIEKINLIKKLEFIVEKRGHSMRYVRETCHGTEWQNSQYVEQSSKRISSC